MILRTGMLIAVLVALIVNSSSAFLPPLERAIDSASVALLVWALAPHPRRLPRLGSVILVSAIVLIGLMYAFLAQEWLNQVESGLALGGLPVGDVGHRNSISRRCSPAELGFEDHNLSYPVLRTPGIPHLWHTGWNRVD